MNQNKTLFTTSGVTDSDRILHTPGEFAKKNLLYVQEVGRLKSLKPHKSQREKLDSFLFMEVLSGEGTIIIGEKDYKILKGDCVFLNCMEYYAHESSEDQPWELMWVHFNGNQAKAYFDLFLERNDGKNIFRPIDTKAVEKYIGDLMENQKKKDLESELASGSLLISLLNLCLTSVLYKDRKGQEQNRAVCNEIRECVNERYREAGLMDYLAGRYDMDEESLNRNFQKAYGIELCDYILNRRFTAAKELLRFTVKPIKEIVEESGIRNGDLFRRLFLDSEGMSAEEYRMKWAQWVK